MNLYCLWVDCQVYVTDSRHNYPRFRVKMFGVNVGAIRVWVMSDVQVGMTILVLI